MRFRRHPWTPPGLRRAAARLRKIHDRREHRIDLGPARHELLHLIDGLAGPDADGEVKSAVDKYVDTYVTEFRSGARGRHDADLNAMELIKGRVEGYVARFAQLHEDDTRRLRDLDAAVAHALDNLGQPDAPFISPLVPDKARA